MKYLVTALLGLCLTALAISAQAAIYKWVDEQGKVHYSDRPQGTSSHEVPLKNTPAAPSRDNNLQQRQEQQKKLLQVFEDERKAKEQAQAETKAKQAEREKQCALAKVRLKNYEDSQYLYAQDQDKREILTHEQRKQATVEAKQAVEEWCG